MVLKQVLAQVLDDQQSMLLRRYENAMPRSFSSEFKPALSHIEVVSGVRRCGKSTLMAMVRKVHYPDSFYINFEDSRLFEFEAGDFQKLDEIVPKQTQTWFFDEIQNITGWELFVRQLHDRGCKIFITGSNASLLSTELGTRLTGRYIRHDLFPFSYSEFISITGLNPSADSFDAYLETGGFPEFITQKDPAVLQNLFKDILLRDIAIRHGIRNTQVLMEMALFLITNTGKETTYNSLKKQFGMGAANTASDYLHWMEESWLFSQLQRFSWSAKTRTANPRKIYAIDTGLVRANSLSFSADRGRRLENAVYLHLRRAVGTGQMQIYYFREKQECDFVVFEKGSCTSAIQVCEELTPDNLKRETGGLTEALNYFGLQEGLVITRDQADTISTGGKTIRLIPAYRLMHDALPDQV